LEILINRRLLHPPDVGSEGKDVVDEEEEMKYAIGVVIDRDLFPDKLFAPAKRVDLMPDGTNPVLEKELRSEIFSQGTLMLRVVIQVSMLLSIPLMAGLLFLRSDKAAYYVAYVLTFNLLVGPVFSAGSITQERERQTLSLLLTTLLTPGRIILAKLLAALRVSTVLTFLLTEQLLLAYVLLPELRFRFWTLMVFLLIIATTCLATSSVGLMCSALVRKTSTAMVLTYLTLLLLFVLPMGLSWYLEGLVRDKTVTTEVVVQDKTLTQEQLAAITITSPFSAALSVPMHTSRIENWTGQSLNIQQPPLVPLTSALAMPVWTVFLILYPPLSLLFLAITYLAFRWRWWKAGDSG
jgi:ABC-type transport system involved in multi-copper enzyme maturation permease subunit